MAKRALKNNNSYILLSVIILNDTYVYGYQW